MSKKKTICALSAGAAVILAAGAIEAAPVISALLIIVLAVCVKTGRLWEV